MRDALHPRVRCMDEIRALCNGNEFLTRYALLYALESLDLETLNRVVDALVETNATAGQADRYARLRTERFGR